MKKSSLLVLAATAATLVASAAPAIAAAPRDDPNAVLRCLLAAQVLTRNADPKAAQLGQAMGMFWLGRLDRSMTETDIEQRLQALTKTLKPTDAQVDIKRCGQEMQSTGQLITRVGQKLNAGAPQPGKPPAKP